MTEEERAALFRRQEQSRERAEALRLRQLAGSPASLAQLKARWQPITEKTVVYRRVG